MATWLVRDLICFSNLRSRLLGVARGYGQLNASWQDYADFIQVRGCVQLSSQRRLFSANVICPSRTALNKWNDDWLACREYHFTHANIDKNWMSKNWMSYALKTSCTVRHFSSQNSDTGSFGTVLSTSSGQEEQRPDQNTKYEHIPNEQLVLEATQNLYMEDQPPVFESDTAACDKTETDTFAAAVVDATVVDSSAFQDSLTVQSPSASAEASHDPTSAAVPSSLTPTELQDLELEDLPAPKPMEPSYNLAPFVAQSKVLQQLVGLGIDLSAVEKIREVANFVVQADWDADIQPRLLFLRDVGVLDSDIGKVLTKNPLLLKEDVDDMQVRINYFQSKKFAPEQISYIVTSAPLTLLMPVKNVDKKLGFLQKSFHLTGNEVRHVATRLPKIIPWRLQKLKDVWFYMKEMLGFSEKELKDILLVSPRVYLSDKYQLGAKFDFLHNVVGMSHQHLITWPNVFRTRLYILKQRHRFLLLMGRAQYDPTKENYVSLKSLAAGRDRDFCFHVAKASTTQFQNFLKTL